MTRKYLLSLASSMGRGEFFTFCDGDKVMANISPKGGRDAEILGSGIFPS